MNYLDCLDLPKLLPPALIVCGIAQLALCVVSLAIPVVLKWQEELSRVSKLTRQIHWTYAGYILITHLCFGLVSVAAADQLTDGTTLAAAITGFIALWWGARLAIQFFFFDRSELPATLFHRLADHCLTGLFIGLAAVYGTAFFWNLA